MLRPNTFDAARLQRVVEMARQAVDWLPAGDTAVGSSMLIAGDAYCWLGEATAGRHAFREAGRIALESGNHSLEVMAACRASDVLARQARLHEAFEASREALQLATLPSGRQLLSAGFPKLQMSQLLCEWHRMGLLGCASVMSPGGGAAGRRLPGWPVDRGPSCPDGSA